MILTKSQINRFFREWSAVVKYNHWGPNQAEIERHALLKQCGFTSLTLVDRTTGYDRLLAELGRRRDLISRTIETLPSTTCVLPAGHGAQVHRDTRGYRRRLFYLIRKHAQPLGGEPYILALARDRFGLTAGLSTIEDLPTDQLHQLMITLAARSSSRRKEAQNKSLSSEESFQDDIEFLPENRTEPELVGTASHSENPF